MTGRGTLHQLHSFDPIESTQVKGAGSAVDHGSTIGGDRDVPRIRRHDNGLARWCAQNRLHQRMGGLRLEVPGSDAGDRRSDGQSDCSSLAKGSKALLPPLLEYL